MDKKFIKNFISRLSRYAFEAFILNLFKESIKGNRFEPFPEIGDGVFREELLDSYGGSIHALYLIHFLPIEVFNQPKQIIFADPTIIRKLARIKEKYTGQLGQWGMVSPYLVPSKSLNELYFLNNFANIDKKYYEEIIFPRYKKILNRFKVKPHQFGIGSCDTFIENNFSIVEKVIKSFLSENGEELCISLKEEHISVQKFKYEKSIFTGVTHHRKQPYETVYSIIQEKESVLIEFEHLINKRAKESEIEKFILSHYIEIFGSKYDRIETQLWLKFPGLDISSQKRRLDIFLRNSVTSDWELFELKRPVKVTSSYRDVPTIASEVSNAIQQIRNYDKILSQDRVKKEFAKEGIEYYEPSLNLVIGRTPQIPLSQWRWLLKTNEKDLKIFTFDELLKEMQIRLNDLYLLSKEDNIIRKKE